ncbi:MAG: DUF1624 domain-containing protein [Clostridia bacterium]|nr:DUF1624 domain-containing protein [Clostridia bacterium]
MKRKSNTKRLLLPDTLRGFLVIEMIVYHLLFDLYYMFNANIAWFAGQGMRLFQLSILSGFVLLSGFCFPMGKRKIFRAAQVFVCGLIIILVTVLVMPSQKILFGVLSCLGLCMLLMTALEKPLTKINPAFGFLLFALLGLLTYGVRSGYIGIFTHPLIELPDAWYTTSFLFPLGLKNANFRSSDYVPLLPWFFVFVCGFYLNKLVYKSEKALRVLPHGIKPLAVIGRYSLWIYMAHQPIIYGVLWLIFKLK